MTLLKGKRRAPKIVRGGRAIPFGNPNDNLYYLQGRSHAKGGIDIGTNPRTGIEAEGGEVVQIKPNELRVLSAQDFIGGGVSPAKQVLAGANPDRVFNEQERFKDRHRINDDGSKYETGGDKTYNAGILPTVDIVGDYNTYWRATKKKKANQIANAVRQGTSNITPLALGLVGAPVAMGLASNGLLGATIDGASIISNPTDPLNYIPYANKINPKKVKSYLKNINASNGNITVDIINNNGYNKDVHEFYKTQWYPRFIEQLNNEKSDLLKGITISDKYNEIEKVFPIDKYINYSDRNELKKLEDILGREITIDEAINLNKYRDKRFNILDIERRAKKAKDYINDSNNFKFNVVKDDNGADSFTFMNDVYIRESDLDRGDIIAHEIRHRINNDYDFRLNDKQIQELEKNYITDIGSNLHGGEASSSRSEKISSTEDMKYIIFDNIKNQLGRYPTREELGKALNEYGENNMRKLYNDDFLKDKSNYHKDYYNNAKRIGKSEQFYKNVGRMIDIIPSVGTGIIINQSNQKRNGGMIATINGNVKNGLISTPRPKAKGGTDIHIKPSKRGTFTAAAKAHGKSVQGFASQVLANKDNYSSAMVKKANFARNASKWNHKKYGGRAKAEGGIETTTGRRGTLANDTWETNVLYSPELLDYYKNIDLTQDHARQDAYFATRNTINFDPSGDTYDVNKAVLPYQQWFSRDANVLFNKINNNTTPRGNTGNWLDSRWSNATEQYHTGINLPRDVIVKYNEQLKASNRYLANDPKNKMTKVYEMPELLEAPNIDIPQAVRPDLSPIGRNTSPTGGQDKTPQSPTPRRGIRWNDDLTSLAGNVLGTIGSFGADLWGSNLRSWNPYTESPVKLKTNWNINPQLDRIRESSQEAYRDIDANTASSSTALARKQRVRNQAQYAANEQWGLKENKETELINKDKLNLQGVRNRNTNRLNTWAESDANIANMRRRLRGAAVSNLFDNLNKSLQGYIGRRDQRRKDEATERMFNRAYPHGAAMARDIQSRESSGDATIPSLATNPIAIAGRLATERLDDDIVAQTKKRCGGKTKRK